MIRAALLLLPLCLLGLWFVPAEVAGTPPQWTGRAFAYALPLHLLATAAWIALVRAVRRGAFRPSFAMALAFAALLRAIVLPLAPACSDDVNRYLHEGQMVLALRNPYATAPAGVDPAGREGRYWTDREDPFAFHRLVHGTSTPKVNHPEVPAAYPPLTQYALAAGVLVDPTPLGMKLLFGCVDLLLFAVLWGWLGSLGLPGALAIVHGLCPLAVLETAGEGHADPLAALGMVLGLWACRRGRWALCGLALGCATGARLLPAVLLPFVLRDARGPGSRRGLLLGFLGTLLLLWLPFLGEPGALFDGLSHYAMKWRANDSLFALLHAGVAGLGLPGDPAQWAKAPLALLFSGVAWLCWRRNLGPERTALALLTAYVALTPTLHPWYLLLWLPLVALRPEPGWLAFAGTVFLAYHVLPGWLADGVWSERWWVKAVEYVPFYLGCLAALRGGRGPLPRVRARPT